MSNGLLKPKGLHVDNNIKITRVKKTLFGWLQEGVCAACQYVFCIVFTACPGLVWEQAGGPEYGPNNMVWWNGANCWCIYCTLMELQLHKYKGCDDTDDFSKQNTLLSHLNSVFPSCWCIFLCSHLCWLLPKKLSQLMQILRLLIPFDGGCHFFLVDTRALRVCSWCPYLALNCFFWSYISGKAPFDLWKENKGKNIPLQSVGILSREDFRFWPMKFLYASVGSRDWSAHVGWTTHRFIQNGAWEGRSALLDALEDVSPSEKFFIIEIVW